MAVTGAGALGGTGQSLNLDTLVHLGRRLRTHGTPRRLSPPEGMTAPWAATRSRSPPTSVRS